jgi:tetratricopeptide (TPR) repeat protein
LHEVKGLWLLQSNRLDEARENLDLAAGLYPNGMADAGLAAIELREGDPEAARAKARKALVEDPNNAIARRVLEKAGAPQPGTQ